ncbi:MAG: DedA family protein [Alphaproteobacteria bacterium]|nr:DedA family protein [Alphaproteobacteria bacterium]
MLDRVYSRAVALAASDQAIWVMAAVSFAESSFFPLPPDILLIPMILSQPRRAWLIAAVCTVSSVLGGFVGYAIGYFLFDTVGRPVLEFYGAMDKYETLRAAFAQWGSWIIILKGLTPIPFKLVTIASGVAQFDLVAFALASLISRSLRFFLLAALLWWFGDAVREFIERRLMLVTAAFAAALVGGFVVLHYL